MRKSVFIIMLLAFAPTIIFAQTFHAIIFANTKNKSIGQDVEVDFQRMGIEMTTIAKSIGYEIKKYYCYGTDESFCRNSLERVLSNLACAHNDIVFFYYSGHGGRAMNEKTDFPEMCLLVNGDVTSESQLYPLYNVYTRIKQKRPRLAIVMGDLCNSVMKYYRSEGEDNASKGPTIMSKGTCNVYKNLFLNVTGGLIAASSEPGYSSSSHHFQQNGEWYTAGGYLTHSFLSLLQYYVSQGEDVSWEELFQNVISYTKRISHGRYDKYGRPIPDQVPIYKSELTVASAPSTADAISTPPQIPTPSNDAATDQRDNLAYALSMVASQNVAKLDRIRNIKKAKSYFADTQVRVQVVGFDNKTIVNTCSAESYLNYLSIATNMESVVVLDAQKNASGKVTYARVHEIHYK